MTTPRCCGGAPGSRVHAHVLLLAVVATLLPFAADGLKHTDTYESKLKSDMLSSYNPKVRPVLEESNPVNVSLSAAFAQLVEVNQISGILTVVVWVRQDWTDPYLAWTNATYDGIGLVTNYATDIWVPNVVLLNEAQKFLDGMYMSNVYSYESGYQYWSRPGTMRFLCDMTLTNFPFDVQRCTLTFGSWDYSGLLQEITMGQGTQDMGMIHSEWEITSIEVKRSEIYYPCCPTEPWPEIAFTLVMKRRPQWYFVYLIFPTLVVTAIMMAGFFIHPTSGERVGLGVTSLLTTIALLFIAKDQLPVSSESTVIGDFFMGCIMYNLVSFMETTLVIYLTWLPRDHKTIFHRLYNVITTLFWSIYDKEGAVSTRTMSSTGDAEDPSDPPLKDAHRGPTGTGRSQPGKDNFTFSGNTTKGLGGPPGRGEGNHTRPQPRRREGGGHGVTIDPHTVDLSLDYSDDDDVPGVFDRVNPRSAPQIRNRVNREGGGGGAPNGNNNARRAGGPPPGGRGNRRPPSDGHGLAEPRGPGGMERNVIRKDMTMNHMKEQHGLKKDRMMLAKQRDAEARENAATMKKSHKPRSGNALDPDIGSGFRDSNLVLKAGSDFGRPEPRRVILVRGDWMDFSRMLRVALVIDKVFRILIPLTFSLFITILFSVGAANQSGISSGQD